MTAQPQGSSAAPALAHAQGSSMTAVERSLRAAVEGDLRFEMAARAIYSTDASVYQIIPAGVVIPRHADDVRETLRVCRAHGLSLTARGGGTSQCGQSLGSGIQVDFSKYMRRILDLDLEEQWVRVEPGLVLAELNAWLERHGLQLPLDLSTANRATIGGMIANNSSGTRSIVYGSTIDYVQELTVLLADGSVVNIGPVDHGELELKCSQDDLEGRCYRTVRALATDHADEIRKRFPVISRRVGGYNLDRFVNPDPFDLTKILVGSEGTLGMILEAKLRLVTLPGAKVLCVAQFPELRDALTATPSILEHRPSAVELMDRNLLEMTRGKREFEPLREFIVGDPGAILIVEFMADDPEGLSGRVEGLAEDLGARGLTTTVHRAFEAREQAKIWRLRQAGLGLSMAEKGDTKAISFVEDTAVSPHQLAEYIDRFQAILREHDTEAIFYAHASVGLLHIRPALNMKTVAGVEAFRAIAEGISDLALEFGGALSAEHGDGLARSPFQEKMFGPELYGAFRQLKRAFDDSGVFNPGKIVDPEPLTSNLKFGIEYQTNDLPTTFDFSDFGGISRAAEQCGGVGTCRKTLAGTMCPSYMATRDDADSTRGRANALRLAISGQLGPLGLADPGLYPLMDLCLECKACKAECPTGVDMARLKSEFLHQYQQEHGATLRSRLLASAEGAALWSSRVAPVSNWVLGSRVVRRLGESFLGLDARRIPPAAIRATFTRWWRKVGRKSSVSRGADDGTPSGPAALLSPTLPAKPGGPGPSLMNRRIALFADTFTEHYEPWQGVAAVRLARRMGAEVTVPPRVCCGRPLISKGSLDKARRQAERTTHTLMPLAEAGVPVVFCEPGCYSAVKDDHPLLVRSEMREPAERVAAACVTFEEWAAPFYPGSSGVLPSSAGGSVPAPGREILRFTRGPGRILLHGHCHQKALVGLEPTLWLLSQIPESEVVDADAGCCGMAGSFGYEREHYSVSRAVGERRLFPAVREAGRDTWVVAPGFSCRHQIRHFTGVKAISVMELLEGLTE